MRFTIGLVALAFQAVGVLSLRSEAELAALVEECGDLGVAAIPEGADPSHYRHCANHPLGEHIEWDDNDLAPMEVNKPRRDVAAMKGSEIFARACYDKAPYGCDRGYCWKTCGSPGEWCWTALGNDGRGDWRKCAAYTDCSGGDDHKCGQGCKQGSKACGCSC